MRCLLIICLLITYTYSFAQERGQTKIDSLLSELEKADNNIVRANVLYELSDQNRLIGNLKKATDQIKQSLEIAQKASYTKGIAKSYNLLGIIYYVQGKYKESLENSSLSLKVSQQMGYQEETSQAYVTISAIKYAQGNYPDALDDLLASLKIREKIGDKRGVANAYNNMGAIYYAQNNNTEALKSYIYSFEIMSKIGDKKGISTSYGNIGGVYMSEGNYPEAIKNYNAALEIYAALGDTRGIANTHYNLGIIHRNQGNYIQSFQHYNNTLEIARTTNDKRRTAATIKNLGDLYLAALSDTNKTTISIESISSFAHVANISPPNKTGILRAATKLLEDAAKDFKEMNAKHSYQQTQHSLSQAYSLLGNHQDALKAFREHSTYKDSLFNEENTKKITRIEVQYIADKKQDSLQFIAKQEQLAAQKEMQLASLKHEYEKKQALAKSQEERRQLLTEEASKRKQIESDHALAQAENKRKEAEMLADQERKEAASRIAIEREKGARNVSLAGILLFLGIGMLLFYQNRQRKRHNITLNTLNKELEQANATKLQFFGILNHDLRRPVSNLVHFLQLKKDDTGTLDDDSKNRLEQQTTLGAENLLNNMEDLLLWSKGQMEYFSPEITSVTVQDIFERIVSEFSEEMQHIHFVFDNHTDLTLHTDKNYLQTIVRNLTSNAVKALKNMPNARIHWKADTIDDRPVLLIHDNGPGADSRILKALYDDKEVVGIKSGFGLHLIRDLAKAIHVNIQVDSTPHQGTTFCLYF